MESVESGGQESGRQKIGAYLAKHLREYGLLFALMHQGGPDTHEEPGTEIWAFNTDTERRGYRIELEEPSAVIEVSKDADPLLYVASGFPASVQVRKAGTGRLLHVIPQTGLTAGRIQAF